MQISSKIDDKIYQLEGLAIIIKSSEELFALQKFINRAVKDMKKLGIKKFDHIHLVDSSNIALLDIELYGPKYYNK